MSEQAELQSAPERSPEEEARAAAFEDFKGQLEWQLRQVPKNESGNQLQQLSPGSTIDRDVVHGVHVAHYHNPQDGEPGMSATFDTGPASWLRVTFPDHGEPYCETYSESLNPVTHVYEKASRHELSADEITGLADTLGRAVNPRYQ